MSAFIQPSSALASVHLLCEKSVSEHNILICREERQLLQTFLEAIQSGNRAVVSKLQAAINILFK